MRRRRRSRSRFSAGGAIHPLVPAGAALVLIIGLFIYFMGRADQLAPAPQEIRIDLPDAFK